MCLKACLYFDTGVKKGQVYWDKGVAKLNAGVTSYKLGRVFITTLGADGPYTVSIHEDGVTWTNTIENIGHSQSSTDGFSTANDLAGLKTLDNRVLKALSEELIANGF